MKKLTFKILGIFAIVACMSLLNGCASSKAPLPMAENVDIDRFMGRWYVVGYTPILVDKAAHNAIEHYGLDESKKIQTTYQFRDGGFDGELKTHTPVGWVHDEANNAEWRMQFIWPFRSDYIILYVDAEYTRTIIAHPNRKYAWIMQREPEISDADYEAMLQKLEVAGYDRSVILQLPQDWSTEADRLEDLKTQGL
ncbi:MAG: lipocalin family protein [Opitutales bacterium]|jgi:apolipoprotein D and lipocalin family protein|nr:lipocalin family protein [Opitutales bacterium]MDP4642888.1 lipocalin family protein [Opitutales bacterium]MDP4776576.1 lipocalin family protein [Opitutales bacterium]MDP4878289.1 lipocalin family protein [Opitutales bacterium]MDP4882737.1 lipocalin family protein [Opitutales bacterium]